MPTKLLFIIFFISFTSSVEAISFNEAINLLKDHDIVKSGLASSEMMKEMAGANGSWGDPKLKLAAKNYPQSSLDDRQTPMTGIGIGLSQKISFTTKYNNYRKSTEALAKSTHFSAKDKMNMLNKHLWNAIINHRKIKQELGILNENLEWISKILKVSKKLYANGKTSQQAILDIQIRKSELESSLSNKEFELKQIDDFFDYLIGENNRLDINTVPWKVLETGGSEGIDFRELAVKEELASSEFELSASKLNFIPDATIGFEYTKRQNIDGNGDFVSASITFPLPFSGKKYSGYGASIQRKYSALKKLKNFQKEKRRDQELLKKEIEKITSELSILDKKTIKLARNSRTITSKSYGLGNSTYVELLQSELKLQKILLKRVMLESMRDMKKVNLKYVNGEKLYE